MDRIRKAGTRDRIEGSLNKLASGFIQEEVTEKFYVVDEVTGEVKEVTRRRKYYPPDSKAIDMLARKYCDGEFTEKKIEEKNIHIRITQKNRALSLDERIKLLESDSKEGEIEAEYREIESQDAEDI
jgi:hypothetical protein